ncbi:IclR family transcriptional regulator [Sphingopyxis yananensis]|uniref:IclR family transcriptional regulator n=1 Tax=Sphingopyxis yananensis TaxID=2886687 RepID=UPI001D0FEBFB|nr:helix-turn-helix domain-containing protein [Sphingopyxis yananensis]MCC2601911.1 helix-turn-helix domain-containing protein [Sphingopyxis yananensis]
MASEVRSVTQAFAILRLLGDTQPLTLSETARLVGLGPSTCFNLLRTLLAEGAVVRDDPGKKYRLSGPWAASGLFHDSEARHIIERARPLIARFAIQHEVTVGLWQVAPKERLQLVAHAESNAAMVIRLANHQRQPLGSGSVGRATLAAQNLPQAEIQRLFGAVRWQRALSFSEYLGQIRSSETEGFAIDNGYAHVGIASIAAVVPQAAPLFSLSLSFFAGSRSSDEIGVLGHAVRQLGQHIADESKNIG